MIAVAARVVDETRARIRPPVRVVDRYDVGLVAVRRELEEQAPRSPPPIHVEVHPIVAARERGHLATLCPIAPPLRFFSSLPRRDDPDFGLDSRKSFPSSLISNSPLEEVDLLRGSPRVPHTVQEVGKEVMTLEAQAPARGTKQECITKLQTNYKQMQWTGRITPWTPPHLWHGHF